MATIAFDFADRKLFVRLFGRDVYAVGGFVRDLLRGRPSPDVDLLVARRPLDDIVARLERHGRVDLVGKSFGIIKFTVKGRTYDVALPRTDRAAAAAVRGHKDILVAADPGLPVEKDLARRDFRTNSMALRLADGLLIDPFPSIYPLARAVDLSGLSLERVNDEMFKVLLRSARPSVGLEEMFRLGVLEAWFPELQALALVIQDAVFHPETDAYGHHTVWAHTKLAVDQAAALAGLSGLPEPRRLALVLAALYHDLGKVSTTRWAYKRGRMAVTSLGHDIQSERAARRVLARFKVQTWGGVPIGRLVPLLIRSHHRAGELWTNRAEVTKKAFNRLAADVEGEIELLVLLDAADRAGRGTRLVRGLDRQARWLFKKFEELRVNRETIKPLVMGRDLLALGVPPGPGMGKILAKLYKAQLDNAFETKAQGLERARRLVERSAS
ncbi:MAG: HD domain-containing protein [Acidobacteria bacterium]|nr:HD domain-containing protein [Acidobacteriota bacterium]